MGLIINPLQPAKRFLEYGLKKKILVIIIPVILLIALLQVGYTLAHRDITVVDNNKSYKVEILRGNVSSAIKKAGLKLNKEDLVEPSLKSGLKQGMTIKITRAFPVRLLVDGKAIDIMTPYDRVGKILETKKVKLDQLDRVEPDKEAKVGKGAQIKVVRVEIKTETKQEELAFSIEKRDDNNMQKGQTKVIQEGKKGLAEVAVKVTFEDGQEIKREITSKKVITEPVKNVVAIGTINYMIASRGETIKYSKVLRMYATWYTAPSGRHTASGLEVHKGVVSVPPSIPFGTKLYIPGYGYAVAADRGRDIKGNRIDLFFDRNEGWSNKYVDVYFVE